MSPIFADIEEVSNQVEDEESVGTSELPDVEPTSVLTNITVPLDIAIRLSTSGQPMTTVPDVAQPTSYGDEIELHASAEDELLVSPPRAPLSIATKAQKKSFTSADSSHPKAQSSARTSHSSSRSLGAAHSSRSSSPPRRSRSSRK